VVQDYLGTPTRIETRVKVGRTLPKQTGHVDWKDYKGDIYFYTVAHDDPHNSGLGHHFLLSADAHHSPNYNRIFRLHTSGEDKFGGELELFTAYALFHTLPVQVVSFEAAFGGTVEEVEEWGKRTNRWFTSPPGSAERTRDMKRVVDGMGITIRKD
jgi:hypothetical protein